MKTATWYFAMAEEINTIADGMRNPSSVAAMREIAKNYFTLGARIKLMDKLQGPVVYGSLACPKMAN